MTTQTIVLLLLLVPLALLVLACIEGWKNMSSPDPQQTVEPQKSDTGTSQGHRPVLHRGPLLHQPRALAVKRRELH
jgi:hypothetical protein